MNSGKVYVVGAGLSGLSAAVTLASNGVGVEVIEAAGTAGGRCRSYSDPAFGGMIDNGNHLILSGNWAVQDYLRTIGATERFAGPERTEVSFADMVSGERWTLRPNDGAIPWWVFSKERRVPGTRALDYLALARLIWPGRGRKPNGALWRQLMHPFLLAALNTEPEAAEETLIATVLRETFAKGGQAYRPRIATPTLAAALIDPAIAFVQARNGTFRFGQRLRSLTIEDAQLIEMEVGSGKIPIDRSDAVILAVPPWVAQTLLPSLAAPDEFRAILSGHFRVLPPPGTPPMLGVIGGTVEWVFAFPDRLSVTVSNADRLMDQDRDELAVRLWADVAGLCHLPATLPPWQIVKEKRATFAATAAQEAKRPGAETRWTNLFLAGDWTATGLPATIEGAVRSGNRAANLALARRLV